LNFLAVPLAEYGSLLALFFNFDPSGHLLIFSQLMRYISRIRFFKIQYGYLLETFFRESTNSYFYERISDKSEDYIRIHSKGNKWKYTTERVPLDLVEKLPFKTLLYQLSFVQKLFAIYKLWRFKKTKNITARWSRFIYI
jgi:hypothetical protein